MLYERSFLTGWIFRNSCCVYYLWQTRPRTPDKYTAGNDPILLSYEGGDHYNAITNANHCNIESRPGVKELMTLSASVLKKVLITKTKIPKMTTNAELIVILINKTIKVTKSKRQ